MTNTLIVVALLCTAVTATTAALTRDPARQAVVLALLGLSLTLLFTVLQAPDVALSQLGVGSAVTPLLILLTVRRIRRGAHSEDDPDGKG
ncbi:Na(+)/H(+) antiporter subunit B [Kitasatospora sp. NPDC015120]|uniref:Na(+)/H(+) antiporter subunit B n=1 Tax=Kitasatospora sp. NPDC015120 TaxID=3364023 RepID=UPI0036F4A568